MKEKKPPQGAIADLRSAIDNLSKFAEENEGSLVPHFYHLNVRDGQIFAERNTPRPSTAELARCFVAAIFSNQARKEFSQKKEAVQSELIKAVELIKANYLVLDRLKEGSPTERKLADAAVAAIQRFNQVVSNTKKPPEGLRSRFTRFVFQQTGLSADLDLAEHAIDLPLSTYICTHALRPETISHAFRPVITSDILVTSQKKVSALVSPLVPGFQPSSRERDAFRLKAITLIQQYGDPEEISWARAIRAVHRAPIQSAADTPPGDDSSAYHGVVAFRQTLQLFPGELIVIEASFQRNAHSAVASLPITSSFKLSARSAQTGFPHPSQHNGWALSDKLVPANLPDPLCRRQRKLAKELLPKGRLNRKAKEWLDLKKTAFEADLDRFLALHQQLAETLLNQSEKKYSHDLVKVFFAFVRDQEDPYEMLSLTYQAIADNFLVSPFDKVRDLDAEELGAAFLKEVKRSQRRAERLKHSGVMPGAMLKYTAALGPVFGEAAAGILQQQRREHPRPATPMETSLQMAIVHQLTEFLDELERDTPPNYEKQLEKSLERDIRCFESRALVDVK